MRGRIHERGTMDERQHTSARHPQRRRDHLATRAAPCRVATCKRYGHEMRGTISRENQRKQGCAPVLTVRGTIANNDVNETATKETPFVAAVHKNIKYVC